MAALRRNPWQGTKTGVDALTESEGEEMLLLILLVEVVVLAVAAFKVAAWIEGGTRVRDWSLHSTHPTVRHR